MSQTNILSRSILTAFFFEAYLSDIMPLELLVAALQSGTSKDTLLIDTLKELLKVSPNRFANYENFV